MQISFAQPKNFDFFGKSVKSVDIKLLLTEKNKIVFQQYNNTIKLVDDLELAQVNIQLTALIRQF